MQEELPQYSAGIDIAPLSGSLSGGTVLTLNGSILANQSEVTVNIGGIPCEVHFRYMIAPAAVHVRLFICSPIFYNIITILFPAHLCAAGQVQLPTAPSHVLPRSTPMLRKE